MPGTTTAKLALYKPAEIGEVVDVDLALNDNYDKIDAAIGVKPVTAGSRPAGPYDGMQIRETDTGAKLTWNGTFWEPDCGAYYASAYLPSNATIQNATDTVLGSNVGSNPFPTPVWTVEQKGFVFTAATGEFTVPEDGIYEVTVNVRYDNNLSGNQRLVWVTKTGGVRVIDITYPNDATALDKYVSQTRRPRLVKGDKLQLHTQANAGPISVLGNAVEGSATSFLISYVRA